MTRRIRLGMVGGGQGASIGAVHRIAARLDDQYELVAGALSSRPQTARESLPRHAPKADGWRTSTSPAPKRRLCRQAWRHHRFAAENQFGRPGKNGPASFAFTLFKASARESHQSKLAAKSKTPGGYPAGPG